MKAYQSLPKGYKERLQVNLQSDKRTAAKINAGGAITMAAILVIGHFIVSVREFFNVDSLSRYFIRLGVVLVGYIVYMVLHELTHGVVMKAVGGRSVEFGFTGMYAFAGSHEDYFDIAGRILQDYICDSMTVQDLEIIMIVMLYSE